MTASVFNANAQTFGIALQPQADANSIVWTLLDYEGNPIGSPVPLQNKDGETLASIKTTISMNTMINVGGASESRFVLLTWTSSGITENLQFNYIIYPFWPLRCQVADVRTVIGANQDELKDWEVDVVAAAMYVSEDVGTSIFNAALIAGDLSTVRVNQCIALWAAISLAPSIQIRIAQTQKNELAEFSRYRGLDTQQWYDDVTQQYIRIRDDLLGNSNAVTPIFLTTSNRPPDMFLPAAYILCPIALPLFPDIFGGDEEVGIGF